MTTRSPDVRELHPPGDRPALRARAAEQLITADDPSAAVCGLFDLIAPELGLNVLLLYDVSVGEKLQFIAHAGLSPEQAAMLDDDLQAPECQSSAGHLQQVASDDLHPAFVKTLGLTAYAAMPVAVCERRTSMLGFGRYWAGGFNDDDLTFLETISSYLAAALERIRGEAARRESEERLRLAIEAAGFGTFDHDIATGENFWSPELRAIYGLAPDVAITVGTLFRLVHPDDQQNTSNTITESAKVDAEGKLGEYFDEYRIIRPDGKLRWLSVRARGIYPEQDGKRLPGRFIGVVEDITDRKLAEERLRKTEERFQLALKLGGVASWHWDVDTGDTWVSDSFCSIFGLPPGSRVDTRVFESVIHPDDVEDVRHQVRGLIERPGLDHEFRIIRPSDGEVRWIHSLGGALRDASGSVVRLLGISVDITERVRNQERERLLIREVDHRAKNLLSVIQAVIQLTRARSTSEFIDDVTGRIHALARVHTLIAASRWMGAELSRLVTDEMAPFTENGERVRLNGLRLELKPAAAQSMALVIHELTINAAKYGALSTPGGQIEIDWKLADGGATDLELHWRESGGPAVRAPQRSGFGTRLIRTSIERQLGGTVELHWQAEGLQCDITLAIERLCDIS